MSHSLYPLKLKKRVETLKPRTSPNPSMQLSKTDERVVCYLSRLARCFTSLVTFLSFRDSKSGLTCIDANAQITEKESLSHFEFVDTISESGAYMTDRAWSGGYDLSSARTFRVVLVGKKQSAQRSKGRGKDCHVLRSEREESRVQGVGGKSTDLTSCACPRTTRPGTKP